MNWKKTIDISGVLSPSLAVVIAAIGAPIRIVTRINAAKADISRSLGEQMDARFQASNQRIDDLGKQMDARFQATDQRIDDATETIIQRIGTLASDMRQVRAALGWPRNAQLQGFTAQRSL